MLLLLQQLLLLLLLQLQLLLLLCCCCCYACCPKVHINVFQEISSLSVELCEGEELIVTVFKIKALEVPSCIEREHEFRFLAVKPEDLSGKPYNHPAVVCSCYSDYDLFLIFSSA